MKDPDYPDEVKSVSVGVKYAYDRLQERNPAAAELWTHLALFPGGVSKSALSQIFGPEAAQMANEIEKQSLVESSFADFPAPFGQLLELPTPFRFFALRHLSAGDELSARQSIGETVLAYYFDFPEEDYRGWVRDMDQGIRQGGPATAAFIARFKSELPSIESWLDWAYDYEAPKEKRARAPRLTALLRNLYGVTGELHKQRKRYDRALACALRCEDSLGEATVLMAIGDLRMRMDDLKGARESYENALSIYRKIEDSHGEAMVLREMGDLGLRVDDLPGARENFEKALPIYRQIEDPLGEAHLLHSMGDLLMRVGDFAGARGNFEQALSIYREFQDRLGEANVLLKTGNLQMRVDDLAGARENLEKALPIYQEIQNRLGEADALLSLGHLSLAEGTTEMALVHFRGALQAHLEIENDFGVATCYGYLGSAAQTNGDHARAILLFEDAIAIFRRITNPWNEGIALWQQGESLIQLKLHEAGCAAVYQARELMRAFGNPLTRQIEEPFKQLETLAQSDEEAKTLFDALTNQAESIRQQAIAAIRKSLESKTEGSEKE